MTAFDVIDYREEFFLKTFRRLYLIKTLSNNMKYSNGISLTKAAFVDFLLCNPTVMHRLLVHFKRAESVINDGKLLYHNNIEYGSVQDIGDFSKTCLLLISSQDIKFQRKEGDIFLIPNGQNAFSDNVLSQRWKKEIELIQPILGKSINVLTNAVMEKFNGK